ncbi:MAG: HIT family protein [Bacteroidales bacterium]|nr:HIT family protein [Bacteroidales bacterium]
MTCPFCAPEIKNSVFASTDNFLAIYNIAPIFPGHSLIIPRKHLVSMLDLEKKDYAEMMQLASDVTQLLKKVFKADGFNWSIQEGTSAGQSIEHLHLHIVPRITGDSKRPGDWYPKIESNEGHLLDSESREQITPEEMERIVDKLKEFNH